ncbi:hypothetical protein JK217_08820 [Gluconobacter kondonii]|uniref:hypothetical protein n=1 Tax=Gluconobacter kondonii TaxID=941463 RepID=UPI001B8D1FD4|nr:hypothetical protein [Gluconobacter kondonii]MBS1077852.1 hypothetical protein [Gluconobacter kondonii]
MTWMPCQRITRVDVPSAFRIRGLAANAVICWPDTTAGSGADYSIDFSHLLGRSDRIVEVEAMCSGGVIAWTSTFGTLATMWVQWLCSGAQTATLSVRTATGAVFTATASIIVRCAPQLIACDAPAYAPNAFFLGSAIVPDASGNPLIFG